MSHKRWTGFSWLLYSLALLGLGNAAGRVAAQTQFLFNGKDLAGWRKPVGEWTVVGAVSLDPANPKRFVLTPGEGVLANGQNGRTSDLISEAEFGDIEVHVEFCIPKSSNSGIYLMGRYEVQIYDSYGVEKDQYPGIECGGLYPRWIQEKNVGGHSPKVNVSKPPGEWQSFDITFKAPRFDAGGKKIANAQFVKVVHNGQVIHENVEVEGPTRAAHWDDELPTGPLLIQGDHGPVACRNLRVSTAAPARLKRADSFLGVHFDFHAGPDCTEIGKNTTREMIEAVINQVRPDYLQIDCKGHRGLSSYPTKAGNPAPGFVGDPLRLWRQVTAERGVALYMHYSGVWDSEAIIRHPDWAVINADGSTNKNATSFYGPYADQLLVPQLRELAGVYGVDGAWIDGECWASPPDFGEPALRAFREATGLAQAPRKPGEPHWFEFVQFNREAFRRYLRHYISEVKKTNPDFQLCSNWAYTDHMPEPVSAPVDFLSGDYNPEDSVNSARISARYLARQGKPWDLMAWSFTRQAGKGGRHDKTAVQLQREAAVVLALGGGFQAYFTQKRDGSVRLERMPVMAEVAAFCRERQAVCHHATQVPQIALLYSTEAHYRRMNELFARDPSPFSGTLQALVESQQSVELLGEHHLAGRMAEYPLIVIPEWEYLDPQFKADLTAYVKQGGSLLLMGPKAAALFQTELDVTLNGTPSATPQYLAQAGSFVPTKGLVQQAQLGSKARAFGQLHATNTPDSASVPAASITPLGRGRIAATYFSFSRGYLGERNSLARGFLADLVHELFPKPLVEVRGSADVDVVVNRLNGKLAINLVNTSGPHQTEPIVDAITPVGPLSMIIRQQAKPSKITLEPGSRPLPFEHTAGEIRLTVPRVDIHEIVLVE